MLLGNAIKFVAPGTRPVVQVWAERVPYLPHQPLLQPLSPPLSNRPSRDKGLDEGCDKGAEKGAVAVRLWFADNGIGIPPKAQARIFNMFQRLDKSYDGTGVGLKVARRAVEKTAGRAGLESQPGHAPPTTAKPVGLCSPSW